MSLDFDTIAILLLFAPFAGAALAPPLATATGRLAGWILAIIPAGLFVALCTLIGPVSRGEIVRFGIDWVPALGLRLGFLVDGLGLVFALLVTGIGAIILIYAGSYSPPTAIAAGFLAFLLLFMGAMLGLVLDRQPRRAIFLLGDDRSHLVPPHRLRSRAPGRPPCRDTGAWSSPGSAACR